MTIHGSAEDIHGSTVEVCLSMPVPVCGHRVAGLFRINPDGSETMIELSTTAGLELAAMLIDAVGEANAEAHDG